MDKKLRVGNVLFVVVMMAILGLAAVDNGNLGWLFNGIKEKVGIQKNVPLGANDSEQVEVNISEADAGEGEGWEIISTSNLESEDLAISFQGSKIKFTKFPKSDDFAYAQISFLDSRGTEYMKDYYSTSSPITVNVKGLPDGEYYIQIYKNSERYGTYYSYMWQEGSLKFTVSNGIATYEQSPVYNHNKELFDKNVSSHEAIVYYVIPTSDIESEDERIIKLAKEITSGAKDNYERIKKIHDWVAENIYYDFDSLHSLGVEASYTALEVLETKTAVCGGYANLVAALARALNIPTKVVDGYALGIDTDGSWDNNSINTDKVNHAWNEAYCNGRWVILDATWDSGNEYRNGEKEVSRGLKYYRYFDPTVEAFAIDHKTINSDEFRETVEKALNLTLLGPTDGITLYKDGDTPQEQDIHIVSYYDLPEQEVTAEYISGNKKVATVNKKGVVKAAGIGTTDITVKISLYGAETEKTISVTVKEPFVEITDSMAIMKSGGSYQFKAEGHGVYTFLWKSSDPSIATIDGLGNVTAVGSGTVEITAYSKNGGYSDTVKVSIAK